MICQYCEIGDYFGTCKCVKENSICPFMRRCNVEKRWLPLNTMEGCRIRTEVEKVDMVDGKYHVIFEKRGQLYVDVEGMVVVANNPFDATPEKVDVTQVDGKYYVVGYEPKPKMINVEPKVVEEQLKPQVEEKEYTRKSNRRRRKKKEDK